jgi:hypothetical protein
LYFTARRLEKIREILPVINSEISENIKDGFRFQFTVHGAKTISSPLPPSHSSEGYILPLCKPDIQGGLFLTLISSAHNDYLFN